MKTTFLIVSLLTFFVASKIFAFEIYNQTNADIYAVGDGHTSGTFEFGIIRPGEYSKSWRPENHGIFGNLPAYVYVCWYANRGCSWTNIHSSNLSAIVRQNCKGGHVLVSGNYSSSSAPSLQADQDGSDCS